MDESRVSKKPYVFWFVFYFLLFWLLFGSGFGSFCLLLSGYLILILISLMPASEALWRRIYGVRPLRLRMEKNRLLPLFTEVYEGAIEANPELSKEIQLYIKEDMSVNAFAFGLRTLVLTRGSIELLNDECLKGLIAHEFGHFAHGDTTTALCMMTGNFLMSLLMKALGDLKKNFDREKGRDSLITVCFKTLYDAIYCIFRGIQFVGDLVIMHVRRKSEYQADLFAVKSGFGQALTGVLIQIYQMTFEKPKSIKEQMTADHPPITIRIERQESFSY